MSSVEMITLLRGRFAPPAWAFLEQCGNGTGAANRGWADAIAMNLWPSRGLEIVGIEVKVSRSDWVSELKKPEKAENMANHCDTWYLAVSDRAIVNSGELPAGWGLLAPDAKGLKCFVEPSRREAVINRSFLAAVLRRVMEQLTPEAQFEAERRKARADGVKEGIEIGRNESGLARQTYMNQDKMIKEFEEASGVMIRNAWSGGDIGLAVKAVMDGGLRSAIHHVEWLRDSVGRTHRQLCDDLEHLKKAT